MNFVALTMLTGDRSKYFGLVFAIAFSTMLLENQVSIFAGILQRTTSQIVDVTDAPIWVMDPRTEYAEEVKPLNSNALLRVRGVSGVRWAVPLFKGIPRLQAPDGRFRQAILMGLDDSTLVGAPRRMLVGSIESLQSPDAIIMDRAGYRFFYPEGPLELGKVFEMNDRRAKLVGIAEASAPFATFPVVFSRYSEALRYVGPERNLMSFILVKPRDGVAPEELCRKIERTTRLRAATTEQFARQTIGYYLRNTGIPVNFGITIALAFIVGAVVAGQTFYMFTLDNLRYFGALKAIGVTDGRLTGMIVLQALVVAGLGFAIGTGLCAAYFEVTLQQTATRGIVLRLDAIAGTACVMAVIVLIASLLSIRRVLVLEPAAVFRG
jgi:putative ABC transport system permease protein